MECSLDSYNTVMFLQNILSHWLRVTHICVCNLTSIGADNGLSPDRWKAIIWTNTGIVLIGTLGTNFSEILIEIYTLCLWWGGGGGGGGQHPEGFFVDGGFVFSH